MKLSLNDRRLALHARLRSKGKSPQTCVNQIMNKLPGLKRHHCAHYYIPEYSEGEAGCTYKEAECFPNECKDYTTEE
jgi:hypothetical protein